MGESACSRAWHFRCMTCVKFGFRALGVTRRVVGADILERFKGARRGKDEGTRAGYWGDALWGSGGMASGGLLDGIGVKIERGALDYFAREI